MNDQQKINDFVRRYAESGYKRDINKINLTKGQPEHNKRICEICCELIELDIPFFTEFRTKFGLRLDIATPTHVKKLIEVLHSETVNDFFKNKRQKLPDELKSEIILNSTKEKFERRQIL